MQAIPLQPTFYPLPARPDPHRHTPHPGQVQHRLTQRRSPNRHPPWHSLQSTPRQANAKPGKRCTQGRRPHPMPGQRPPRPGWRPLKPPPRPPNPPRRPGLLPGLPRPRPPPPPLGPPRHPPRAPPPRPPPRRRSCCCCCCWLVPFACQASSNMLPLLSCCQASSAWRPRTFFCLPRSYSSLYSSRRRLGGPPLLLAAKTPLQGLIRTVVLRVVLVPPPLGRPAAPAGRQNPIQGLIRTVVLLVVLVPPPLGRPAAPAGRKERVLSLPGPFSPSTVCSRRHSLATTPSIALRKLLQTTS